MKPNYVFTTLLLFTALISNAAKVVAEESSEPAPQASPAEIELSFRDVQLLEQAFIDTSPAATKDGILVAEPDTNDDSKEMLITLAQEIADGKYGNHDSLLIAHQGKLVFESYFRKGRINLPHPQASATKTYTSMALGRAIQLGYLTMADLDKPVISFLKDLDRTKLVKGAELITLNNALTMTTGIRITDEEQTALRKDTDRLAGQGQVQAILETSDEITKESQSFLYGYGPDLIMQVINAVTPNGAQRFIKMELLEKMGIANYRWRTHASGLPQAGWGVSMTSRNMLKWGTLLANQGQWNGEQLVPKSFVDKAMSMVIDTGDDKIYGGGKDVSNQGYGYYIWNADLKHGKKSYYSASAQGGGGQFILLVKELDLIIVVTASNGDVSTLQLAAERILPAFMIQQ